MTIAEAQELLAVVEYLYDAAVDPALWGTALRRVSQSLGALGMALWVLDFRTREVLFRAAHHEPNEQCPRVPCDCVSRLSPIEVPLAIDSASSTQASGHCQRAILRTFRSLLRKRGGDSCCLVTQLWLPLLEGTRGKACGLSRAESATTDVLERLGFYGATCAARPSHGPASSAG